MLELDTTTTSQLLDLYEYHSLKKPNQLCRCKFVIFKKVTVNNNEIITINSHMFPT